MGLQISRKATLCSLEPCLPSHLQLCLLLQSPDAVFRWGWVFLVSPTARCP